ncbi:MAG: DUF1566 domain-containing protein [Myxococcaceae bacterium]|nr:DUF1566 domain-containing protein [Myxococcaceae bacterium]MBH2006741.1 DUF1566 domain-containing protein [Myxococcaceae bacterium]
MNLIFASIFFVLALSPNLLAWNLLGRRPVWLQDARTEAMRIGQQIRDSVQEVKPLLLSSAWVPLTRIGDDYIEQMAQRRKRMKELRQEIQRLSQIGKSSEALAAEEELLRLIELGALPEKLQKTGAWKARLDLTQPAVGELFSPAAKGPHSVPNLHLVPGMSEPSAPSKSLVVEMHQASQVEPETSTKGTSDHAAAHVTRTEAISVDPLKQARSWYLGPRESNEVPALEWELDRKGLKRMTFEEAQAYATSRSAEGWRLPTIWELKGLDLQRRVLGEDEDKGGYWSETGVVGYEGARWYLEAGAVRSSSANVSEAFRVRLVRAIVLMEASNARGVAHVAQTQPISVDPLRRADGWYTGPREPMEVPALEWELDGRNLKGMNSEEAEAYATSRSAAGWRLPTIWELEALYQQRTVLGKNDDQAWYWSDTFVIGEDGVRWYCDFENGDVGDDNDYNLGRVRLVRGASEEFCQNHPNS